MPLKSVAERVLSALALARWRYGRNAPDVVLAYHNVVPSGESACGDRSLHVAQRRFGEHLDLLVEVGTVVPLADLLDPGGDPHSATGPRFAVTFDDAYRGALTAGAAELRARGLPATVFIVPTAIGGAAFWWDAIADPNTGLSPTVREHALHSLGGRSDAIGAWAREQGVGWHELPLHALPAAVDDIGAAVHDTRLTMASHTMSHLNLDRANAAELAHELERSRAAVRELFADVERPWLAYPYGLADQRVRRAAEQAGYTAAFRVDGGPLPSAAPRFALPRLNVPAALSVRGLAARLAGIIRR